MTAEKRDLLLQNFDRIFVINLPYRTDRYRQMARQLARVGLSFEDPNVDLVAAVRPQEPGKWPTIGARGCYESHQKVLEAAEAGAYRSILILEDDADWSDNLLADFAGVMQAINRLDWGILHGGIHHQPGPPQFQLLQAVDEVPLTHFMAFQGALVPAIRVHLETLAGREHGDPRGGPMHVDGAYNWFRKAHPEVRTYLAEPSIAEQRASRTDIHPLSWSDRLPVISDLKNVARPGVAKLRRLFKR